MFFASVLLPPSLVGFYLWRIHRSYVQGQKESPFDHVLATLKKVPLAGWCPRLQDDVRQEDHACEELPPMFMINGRPTHLRPKESILTWQNVTQLQAIDTSTFSMNVTAVGGCKFPTWTNHLFHIYKEVFAYVLERYPSPAFVFVEDDTILSSLRELKREMCMARLNNLPFYSFYTTELQGSSCIYTHGMCGFYAKRELLRKVIAAPFEDACRLGVDIYIASIGPWFASTGRVIQHDSRRYRPGAR